MGYFTSQNTEDTTIRKCTCTAEKFSKCWYNISNSDYYWKGIGSYLSRSSSGMGYFISKIPKTTQFENVCLQPRNFLNVDTTFLIRITTGKVLDHTFPEVLPVWDTSYPKIPKM
jgi:hypothetical protein